MNAPLNNRSIPELVSDAFAQLAKLIGSEIELARAEISDKVSKAGAAVGLIGAGAIIMIPALVLILFAIASALIHSGVSEPMAYLCTGVGAALISGALIWTGIGRLSGGAMKPTETLQQLQRDKLAAKEMVR